MDARGVSETGGGSAAGVGGTGWRYVALGTQGGTLSSRRAIDPLVGFGLEAEGHFEAACGIASKGVLPYDARAAAAYDLRYAAEYTVANRQELRHRRAHVAALVKELARRCQPLTAELAKWRPATVQAIAKDIHVGMMNCIEAQ